MMKKKAISLIAATALVLGIALSVALAQNHYNSDSFTVLTRGFTVRCWISEDLLSAGAWTTGGTSTYDKVWATYYWVNFNTQEIGTISGYKYSDISASITAPPLDNPNKVFWQVVSDHRGEYGGLYGIRNGLTITIGN